MEPPDKFGTKNIKTNLLADWPIKQIKNTQWGVFLKPWSAIELYPSQQPPQAAQVLRSHLPLADGQGEI